jgi:hypothetical protein
MKTYHILPKEAHLAECFAGTHYIDLPNGQILLCGEFRDKSQEVRFKAQPGVVSLPHPLHHSAVTGFKHDGLDLSGGESIWQLSEKLKAIHPLMGVD